MSTFVRKWKRRNISERQVTDDSARERRNDNNEDDTTSIADEQNNRNTSEPPTPAPSPQTESEPRNQEPTSVIDKNQHDVTWIEVKFITGLKATYNFWIRQRRELPLSNMLKLMLLISLCFMLGRWFRPPSSNVENFLHQLDLDMYYQPLIQLGYDRLEDLIWATDEDLIIAGVVSRPHRARILRKGLSQRSDNTSLMLYLLAAVFFVWTLSVTIFITAVILYHEVREACKAVILWACITLWSRVRIYRRIWLVLGAGVSENGETVLIDQ